MRLLLSAFHLTCLFLFTCTSSTVENHHSIRPRLIDAFLRNFFLKSKLNALQPNGDTSPLEVLQSELKQLQLELVQQRNGKCLHELHGDFNYSSIQFSQFSASRENNKTLAVFINRTIQDFNNKCIDSSNLLSILLSPTQNQKEPSLDRLDFDVDEIKSLYQILLTQRVNEGCDFCAAAKNASRNTISKLETWGYGILFVTLISASSLCGAFVIPFSKKKIYKKILMFLIAIAVGSLAGSGFLHLIPQAFGITEDPAYSKNHMYVWKSVVMMGGVYLFFLVEIILKLMILRRKLSKKNNSFNQKSKVDREDNKSAKRTENPQVFESIGYLKTHESSVEPNVEMRMHLSLNFLNEMHQSDQKKNHGHSHGLDAGKLHSVAPVAWMIIFGDGLHNFIDGLSIGAAFTESVLKGISICLAVICEEFPHELGDFAILINAGMSYPVALLFNFLSACCCFVGLAVGIILGENLRTNEWIYAVAGGMFLYISLCGMIPELNEIGEEIERDYVAAEIARKKKQHEKTTKTTTTQPRNNHSQAKNNKLIANENEMEEMEESKSLTTTAKSALATHDNKNNNNTVKSEPSVAFIMRVKIKIIIIQNIGILTGFSLMLVMALFADSLQF